MLGLFVCASSGVGFVQLAACDLLPSGLLFCLIILFLFFCFFWRLLGIFKILLTGFIIVNMPVLASVMCAAATQQTQENRHPTPWTRSCTTSNPEPDAPKSRAHSIIQNLQPETLQTAHHTPFKAPSYEPNNWVRARNPPAPTWLRRPPRRSSTP